MSKMKDIRTKIHLYIRGNCGNQFFQYAFARYLQEKIKGDLIINYNKIINDITILPESNDLLSLFNTVPYKYEKRMDFGGFIFKGLKAVHFVLRLRPFEKRTYSFYLKCARFLPFLGIYYFDSAYYPFRIIKKHNIYVNGYFESSKYFKSIDEKLKNELTPRMPLLDQNRDIYEIITGRESVCVTIKRRSINCESIAEIYQYDISFFYNAMDYLKSKLKDPVFIVFSDDIEWCKNNIYGEYNLFFETPNNPIWEKIRLMAACKHFIIHNSTFSWWAQHLSSYENKIVIAPTKWMQRNDQPIDIYEDDWVYMTETGVIVNEPEVCNF